MRRAGWWQGRQPAIEALYLEFSQQRAGLGRDLMPQVERALKHRLTPEQEANVGDLLLQRSQAIAASFSSAVLQGKYDAAAGPDQFQQLRDQASADANQQLQVALGPDNYQRLQARDRQIFRENQSNGVP